MYIQASYCHFSKNPRKFSIFGLKWCFQGTKSSLQHNMIEAKVVCLNLKMTNLKFSASIPPLSKSFSKNPRKFLIFCLLWCFWGPNHHQHYMIKVKVVCLGKLKNKLNFRHQSHHFKKQKKTYFILKGDFAIQILTTVQQFIMIDIKVV